MSEENNVIEEVKDEVEVKEPETVETEVVSNLPEKVDDSVDCVYLDAGQIKWTIVALVGTGMVLGIGLFKAGKFAFNKCKGAIDNMKEKRKHSEKTEKDSKSESKTENEKSEDKKSKN